MRNLKFALTVAVMVFCLLLSPVFAIPTDTPIYWTDDFSQNNVFQSANIYNANWTYTPTQNFTVAVEYGHLTIKYVSASISPQQNFKVWRGISKNENGIYLKWKVSKSSSDPLQLGVSNDGQSLQYCVEFGWYNNATGIKVFYNDNTGTPKYSDVLGSYSYSTWYWVELTYKSPVLLSVKVTDASTNKVVGSWNTTDVRHSPSDLWATAIGVYCVSQTGARTVYFYCDYAQFSGLTDPFINTEFISAIGVMVVTVAMLGVALGFLKKIG